MLRRVLAGMLLAVVMLTGGALVAGPAAAETCGHWVETTEGGLVYETYECGSEDDGDDGGSGGGEETTCYTGRQDSFGYEVAYCSGDLTCYRFIPPPSAPEEADWPERPPGTDENAQYANEACFTQPPDESLVSNEYIWVTPDEPSIEQLVQTAYGSLTAPTFDLGVNPDTTAVVNLPTWFWAQGPANGAVTGTNAGGMVAIAEPDHLEVDPGDGSGTMQCPWSLAEGDACSYTYGRASVSGSVSTPQGPAYEARMRMVYAVRFEFNGAAFSVPGLPTTYTSPWQTEPVPVSEIQTVTGRD